MANSCPIVAVGAVIWRGAEEVLLIRRGQAPRLGEWSIPGGRVQGGETLRGALQREVSEETGLIVRVAGLIDAVDFIERDEAGSVTAHLVLIDFNALWEHGDTLAGGDAVECGWFSSGEALARVSWEETRRMIRLSAHAMWELAL
jgi:8-oxo-dGTP diphosphatase